MSTHKVEVLKIEEVLPHKNADNLELIPVWGYTAIVRKGQFKPGDLAIYLEPDFVCPLTNAKFSFLQKPGENKLTHRVTTRRLRNVWSQGLLVPADPGMELGQNVMEQLGITRYEPGQKSSSSSGGGGWLGGGIQESGPEFDLPKYDLENLQKYHRVIKPGEHVIGTSKLHGSSARFMYSENRMWFGSRTTWKRPVVDYLATPVMFMLETKEQADELESTLKTSGMSLAHHVSRDSDVTIFAVVKSVFLTNTEYKFEVKGEERQTKFSTAWHDACRDNPWIETWCKEHPGLALYGEIYGERVQGKYFTYGKVGDQIGFAVFDIFNPEANGVEKWYSNQKLHEKDNPLTQGLELVPVIFNGPFDFNQIKELAEQDEVIGTNQIREGVVVKPLLERYEPSLGRVALKYVGNRYYDKS